MVSRHSHDEKCAELQRREFLVASSLSIFLKSGFTAVRDVSCPRLGAIRWDAWYSSAGDQVTSQFAENLQPEEYRYRVPFYARSDLSGSLVINGNSLSTMKMEVHYALAAGLSSWNFARHEYNDPFAIAFSLYERTKSDLRFSLRYSPGKLLYDEVSNGKLTELLSDRRYEFTCTGRPLLYISLFKPVQKNDNLIDLVKEIRERCRIRRISNPYIVTIGFSSVEANAENATVLGADAIAAYASFGHGLAAEPYAEFDMGTRHLWDAMKATGLEVIPTGSAGYDPRPREKTNTEWRAHFVNPPTPLQLTNHTRALLEWIRRNPKACPSQQGLFYAWNEFDEGGWVCPTIGKKGTDLSRVEAIRASFRP